MIQEMRKTGSSSTSEKKLKITFIWISPVITWHYSDKWVTFRSLSLNPDFLPAFCVWTSSTRVVAQSISPLTWMCFSRVHSFCLQFGLSNKKSRKSKRGIQKKSKWNQRKVCDAIVNALSSSLSADNFFFVARDVLDILVVKKTLCFWVLLYFSCIDSTSSHQNLLPFPFEGQWFDPFSGSMKGMHSKKFSKGLHCKLLEGKRDSFSSVQQLTAWLSYGPENLLHAKLGNHKRGKWDIQHRLLQDKSREPSQEINFLSPSLRRFTHGRLTEYTERIRESVKKREREVVFSSLLDHLRLSYVSGKWYTESLRWSLGSKLCVVFIKPERERRTRSGNEAWRKREKDQHTWSIWIDFDVSM